MMSKLREIFSEKLRLSGIRGCMAAGAITAGIAALAVIGGVNSEDISTISLETDVIPEETVSQETVKNKTYVHDMEYFSSEDMKKMTSEKKETYEALEIKEAAASENKAVREEETAAAETEAPAEESASETEEANQEEVAPDPIDEETISYEEEAYEADEAADSEAAFEDTSDNSDSENFEEEEEDREETESVAELDSAAGGDEDESGLSSALDFETDTDAEVSEAAAAMAASENAADMETAAASEEADDTAVYKEVRTKGSVITDDTAEAASEEEDMDSVPEDITLDDENETEEETQETAPAPLEGAISLFDIPEWLKLDENGVPSEYVNVLTGNACAYTAEPDALMSTGKEVFQGYVAVDPDVIPYGSELYIVAEDGEVYGYAIAADTGYSVRAGDIIVDLFMNEYDDCIQWGNKPVYVYVLK